jgi:hypothetical protein
MEGGGVGALHLAVEGVVGEGDLLAVGVAPGFQIADGVVGGSLLGAVGVNLGLAAVEGVVAEGDMTYSLGPYREAARSKTPSANEASNAFGNIRRGQFIYPGPENENATTGRTPVHRRACTEQEITHTRFDIISFCYRAANFPDKPFDAFVGN